MSLFQKVYNNFDVYEYLEENPDPATDSNFANMEGEDDFYMKTACHYMIKFDPAFGTLIIKKDRLVFEPSTVPEQNAHLFAAGKDNSLKIDQYRGVLDFLDIIEVNKM